MLMVAMAFAIGLFALFLPFPAQPAEAASITFTTDTTISTDQTIGVGETWTIDSGVTLTIASGVTITNRGIIENSGTIDNNGFFNNVEGATINNIRTINNDGSINNSGTINNILSDDEIGQIVNSGTMNNNLGGTINNGGIIINGVNNLGGTINNGGTIINASPYGPSNDFIRGLNNLLDGTLNNNGIIDNMCGATFFNTGTYTGNPVSYEECNYSLTLSEGSEPSDGVVELGQEVTAIVATNDVNVIDISLINPNGDKVESLDRVCMQGQLDPSKCTAQTYEFSWKPNEVGDWTIEAQIGNVIVHKTLSVRFMVIPESPIGMVALMATSFLALGGFMLWKRKRQTTLD